MFGLILGGLGTIASSLVSALTVGSKMLISIADAITMLMKVLGLTDDEKAEDLGDRVIQAEEDGITPENFDDYDEYLNAINTFKVDKERSKEIDENDKIVKGLDFSTKSLEIKYPDHDVSGLLKSAALSTENQEFFASERFAAIAKEIENNPDLIDSLSKILNGQDIPEDEYYEVIDRLSTIEKRLYPDKSESEIAEYIRSLG